MAEPLVVIVMKFAKFSRIKATVAIGLCTWILGTFALLSFNLLADFTIFNYSIFSLMVDFTTNIILPIGAFGFAIFSGWLIPNEKLKAAINFKNEKVFTLWKILIRYIAPFGILLIFFNQLLSGVP